MLQIVLGYGFVLACALIVILGDTLMKLGADRDAEVMSPYVGIGALLYALSALAWFFAMRHVTLTQGAVVYTMFSLLALCVIAALVFNERFGLREFTGIFAALMAVILLADVA
jgi:undecaprenyl phosphate-alpha-L-ara4N flippase subunit ArnF